jgi:outer membrane protein OmpA-like peptidoglycan-associated protein
MAKKKPKLMTLKIEDLIREDEFQCRTLGTSEERAEVIAETLRKKAGTTERIRVYEVKEHGLIVTDGFTRCRAHELAMLKMVQAEVYTGSLLEARLDAAKANHEHLGLPLTNADKRLKVKRLVLWLREAGQDWSNRKISEEVKVSDHLVADVRNQLDAEETGIPMAEAPKKPKPRLSEAPAADPAGVQVEGWEGMPLDEEFDFDADQTKALEKAGIKTAGQFAAAIASKKRIGLSQDEIDSVMEWIETLKANSPKPEIKPAAVIPTPQGGEVGFNWNEYESHLGYVVRGPDTIAQKYPDEKGGRELADAFKAIQTFAHLWKKLRVALEPKKETK